MVFLTFQCPQRGLPSSLRENTQISVRIHAVKERCHGNNSYKIWNFVQSWHIHDPCRLTMLSQNTSHRIKRSFSLSTVLSGFATCTVLPQITLYRFATMVKWRLWLRALSTHSRKLLQSNTTISQMGYTIINSESSRELGIREMTTNYLFWNTFQPL